jgi:lipoprotein-anchoring transpeptidase ErfK/SrfK
VARMRSGRRRLFVAVLTIVVATVAIWWWRSAYPTPRAQSAARPMVARHELAVAEPVPPPPPSRGPMPMAEPVAAAVAATTRPAPEPVTLAAPGPTTAPEASSATASAALADAATAVAAGNAVQARKILSQAADPTSDSPANEQVLQQLTKLSDDMIFSPKITQNDPLVIKHVVEAGQNLQRIANLYKTTVPLICRINNLSSPNNLRQGQPLKIVLGPFHATVCKHNFRMSVYCQDILVKTFPVGLGAEGATPTGQWTIKLKQLHPLYYPPRGGKVMAADDPKNPLGGYWMALEGIEGAAVGQERYGIHGTIEPDSIGKNASMGCIRMRNEDVSFVYELLVVHDSVVTVKD